MGLGRAYTGHCTHRTIIMRAFCHVWVTSESERVGMAAAMYVLVGSANVRRRTRQRTCRGGSSSHSHACIIHPRLPLPDTRARGEIVVYMRCVNKFVVVGEGGCFVRMVISTEASIPFPLFAF